MKSCGCVGHRGGPRGHSIGSICWEALRDEHGVLTQAGRTRVAATCSSSASTCTSMKHPEGATLPSGPCGCILSPGPRWAPYGRDRRDQFSARIISCSAKRAQELFWKGRGNDSPRRGAGHPPAVVLRRSRRGHPPYGLGAPQGCLRGLRYLRSQGCLLRLSYRHLLCPFPRAWSR